MTIASKTKVSIVTATRNRPHWLRQALLSIKEQDYDDYEAIVVDDGSSQETHQQYKELWRSLDARFKLVQASPIGGAGSGPGRGRNYGIQMAQSELIAFLDHDDFFIQPDHLTVGIRAMLEFSADYYFTHVRFEPEHHSLLWVTPPEKIFCHCSLLLNSEQVYHVPMAYFLRIMRAFHIHPSRTIVRRDIVAKAGNFIEGLRTADDVNLMLRIADVAQTILYRATPSVAIRLPEGASFSLASSKLDQLLSQYHAILDVRLRSVRCGVRKCARAREGYVLREIADFVRATNRWEALLFARQSLATYPTLGAMWFFCRSFGQWILGRG